MQPSLTPDTDADVIIIGAGISGMSAAFYLLEHDPAVNVLVLEASERVGGRALSIPLRVGEQNHLQSFDLGGQFVYAVQDHLMDLVQKLDLQLIETDNVEGKVVWDLDPSKATIPSINLFDLKNLHEKIDLMKFTNMINEMSKDISFNNPHSITDSEKLDFTTMETCIKENLGSTMNQNFMRHVIRTTCGVEPSQITILFYLAFCNSTGGIANQFLTNTNAAPRTRIQGGADQICYKIAKLIGKDCIKTSDPVIRIIRHPDHVTVETEDYVYECMYAIIAIPPKEVLDIGFEPTLSKSRCNLIQSLNVGHLIQFVATYKTAFWRDQGYSGIVLGCGKEGNRGPIHVCYDITNKNWPALTGCIASKDCLVQPVESFKNEVLRQLATYFGEDALNPVDYYEKSWLNVPYIYHCFMNSPGIGNMDKYHELKRPAGRLFWAGTETASCWNGYMGGAVQAGYRAAIEVLYEFRPQILNVRDITFVDSKATQHTPFTNKLVDYGTSWKTYLSIASFLLAMFLIRRRK